MIILNDGNYEEVVSKSDKVIVVDFYADWCGPCKVLSPILERVEDKNPNLVFAKVNVDDSIECARNNNIRNIPTVLFIKDNKVINKFTGSRTEDIIQTMINDIEFNSIG